MMSIFDPTRGSYSLGGSYLAEHPVHTMCTHMYTHIHAHYNDMHTHLHVCTLSQQQSDKPAHSHASNHTRHTHADTVTDTGWLASTVWHGSAHKAPIVEKGHAVRRNVAPGGWPVGSYCTLLKCMCWSGVPTALATEMRLPPESKPMR